MIALIRFVLGILASPFKSKSRLEAENAALRQQLIVLRRRMKGRARLTNADRWFFVQLYRWFPSVLEVLTIIRPETLVRWHWAGFRRYWRWKSGEQGGRPQIQAELRALIRQMSVENPLWGAPRIHGELLKLGFEVAHSSVAKYMVRRWVPPSQGWGAFLHNHAPQIAAMDLFVRGIGESSGRLFVSRQPHFFTARLTVLNGSKRPMVALVWGKAATVRCSETRLRSDDESTRCKVSRAPGQRKDVSPCRPPLNAPG
jgi:hypothetical protein